MKKCIYSYCGNVQNYCIYIIVSRRPKRENIFECSSFWCEITTFRDDFSRISRKIKIKNLRKLNTIIYIIMLYDF